MKKQCSRCRKNRDIKFFWKKGSRLCSHCKDCERKRKKKYKQNPEYHRNYILHKKYGINLKDYQEMFLRQGGKCATCRGDNNGRTFHVDHSHSTGKVRGLLCVHCNQALGLVADNTEILQNMIHYLRDTL